MTHITNYCDKFKRYGALFSVPPLHPYWTLSKKAHPGATTTGSNTPSAGANYGSQSTIGSCMSSFIDGRMTQTENLKVASLLA